jgi:uncharacterized protein (DUF2062 family)
VIVYRILGVKDSPHRIALGVAVAFFVAWTPTLGFQMIIAITLASLLGGNRAVTVPVVWITNPVTAVPLYYTNWCFGHMIRFRSLDFDPTVRSTLAKLMAWKGGPISFLQSFFDVSWWREAVMLLADLGIDLWLGSVVLGLIVSSLSYPVCFWCVVAYRRAMHHEVDPSAKRVPDSNRAEEPLNEPNDVVKSNSIR